jgi:hypothetical protein
MTLLGSGLSEAGHHAAAFSVKEAHLATLWRIGAPEVEVLIVQGSLANTYSLLGRKEEALHLRRDVYSGNARLLGEEDFGTLAAALNYASSLGELKRFEEAKSLMYKTITVARSTLGGSHDITLKMRWSYARTLYRDPGATLEDLREAVTMLEETQRTALRVFGGAHPLVADLEHSLRASRAALGAREAT